MFKRLLAFAVLLLLVLLTSCTQPIEQDIDRTQTPLLIKVVTYDSPESLQIAYNLRSDNALMQVQHPGSLIEGFTEWSRNSPTCTIHVLKIKQVDDAASDVWGHELAHCIYGKYHK